MNLFLLFGVVCDIVQMVFLVSLRIDLTSRIVGKLIHFHISKNGPSYEQSSLVMGRELQKWCIIFRNNNPFAPSWPLVTILCHVTHVRATPQKCHFAPLDLPFPTVVLHLLCCAEEACWANNQEVPGLSRGARILLTVWPGG